MGVYSTFFYTKFEDKHIYYSREYMGEDIEMSLYINKKLVDRQSGGLGVYVLRHNQIKLKLNLKYFKKTRVLTIDNNELEFPQISHKKLKKILNESEIHNEINPILTENEQFRAKDFIFPIATIIIGSISLVLLSDKSKYIQIPSLIILYVGFSQIFKILAKYFFRHTYNNGHLDIWRILFGAFMTILFSSILQS